MKKKVALVLSGGGMHGAFQVGALNALADNWSSKISTSGAKMKFDIVAGVSAGALNGALVAADRLKDLNDLWTQVGNNVELIYKSDFIDTKDQSNGIKLKVDFESIAKKFLPNVNLKINFWRAVGIFFSGGFKKFIADLKTAAQKDFLNSLKTFKAIADNSPLIDTLKNKVNLSKNSIPPGVTYQCGYVSLDTGNYHSVQSTDFTTDDDFINGIVASTSIPIVWAPMPSINTQKQNPKTQLNSIDGGIRNSSPLGDVIKLMNDDPDVDAQEYLIIVINNHNGKMQEEKYVDRGIADIAVRSIFDIALSEIFMNDLAEFMDINNILKQVEDKAPGTVIEISGKKLHRFTAIVIQPEDPEKMGNALVATPQLIKQRIDYGYQQALAGLGGIGGPPLI